MLWSSMILLTYIPGQNDKMEERVRFPWKGDDIWWGLSRPCLCRPSSHTHHKNHHKTTATQKPHHPPAVSALMEIETSNITGKFPFSIFLLWPQLNDHRIQANPKLTNVARKMTLMKKKKKIHMKYFLKSVIKGFLYLGNWFFHLSP